MSSQERVCLRKIESNGVLARDGVVSPRASDASLQLAVLNNAGAAALASTAFGRKQQPSVGALASKFRAEAAKRIQPPAARDARQPCARGARQPCRGHSRWACGLISARL
jgi:hypothetical protein